MQLWAKASLTIVPLSFAALRRELSSTSDSCAPAALLLHCQTAQKQVYIATLSQSSHSKLG